MGVWDSLLQGFAVAGQPVNIFLVLVGCFVGTLIGSLPGIGPINGVAILMPIAYSFGLPAESALILLAGVYYGAEYGGRISSILLNVPGDAGAVMTTIDGHPMAMNGEAGRALSLSAVASFFGGFVALILLTIFAPLLSKLAIKFGPVEFTILIIFALTCLTSLVGKKPVKTLIACVLGLLISMIGIDPLSGVMRYTLGIPDLFGGIDFAIVVIGLFAVSEVFILVERWKGEDIKQSKIGSTFISFADITKVRFTMVRATVIGFLIGVLPGTGASIASAVAYGTEKQLASDKASFGKGNIKGLAAPESANNAAAVGAMVPMLTLGIPGSGTTAVLLGVLLLFNITPSPQLFSQEPQLVWGLIASMYFGNIALLILNLPLVGVFARLLSVKQGYLIPAVIMLTFVGAFSLHGSSFELFLMIVLGTVAYLLRRSGFSLAPIVLGAVLGHQLEPNLRNALSNSQGDWLTLLSSPTAVILWIAVIFMILWPFIMKKFKARDEEI
ncbi:MAG: tripartite tricarboxylate transporter permease [Alphaproteobacteria bacterium]